MCISLDTCKVAILTSQCYSLKAIKTREVSTFSDIWDQGYTLFVYGPFNILLTVSNIAPTYLLALNRVLVEY